MAKVGFRIDTIQPASRSVRTAGSALTTVVAAEDKILFPKTDGTKGSFGSVVIGLCRSSSQVVAKRIPLVQDISERFAQTGLFDSVSFFLPAIHAAMPAVVCFAIVWLPDALLS